MPSQCGATGTLGLIASGGTPSPVASSKGATDYRSAGSLPILDLRALTDEQLRTAEAIFNELPGQGVEARLPRGRRPEPSPPGPPRRLRSPRLRRGGLRRRSPPRRQVVRRAVGPRRQAPPKELQTGCLTASEQGFYNATLEARCGFNDEERRESNGHIRRSRQTTLQNRPPPDWQRGKRFGSVRL